MEIPPRLETPEEAAALARIDRMITEERELGQRLRARAAEWAREAQQAAKAEES